MTSAVNKIQLSVNEAGDRERVCLSLKYEGGDLLCRKDGVCRYKEGDLCTIYELK